jgi:cell division septum initiation protein DivIVA
MTRQWTILALLPVEDFYGPKLTKEVKSLNGNIQRLLDRRVECDKRRDELERADVIKVAALSDDLRAARLDVLQREAQVRRAIDELEEAIHAARGKARDAAIAAHRQATDETREALEGFGYHRPVEGQPMPCCWTPGMVMAHPRVREAADEAQRLSSMASSRTLKLANATALEVVEGELNREREKALASA